MVDTQRVVVERKIVRLFRAGSISLVPLVMSAVDWMAAAVLIRSFSGARAAVTIFAALTLLAPLRLLIRARSVTWPELASVPAACVFWWLLTHLDARRQAALAAGSLATVVLLNGLAPFRLTPVPAAFLWAPFQPMITGSEHIAAVLLLKTFRYGAIVWLAHAAGMRFLVVGGCLTALLACIEAAQVYLAGHVPESTDPLLAAAMALALFALDRYPLRDSPQAAWTA
jgi:hypothetical protein